MTNIIDAFVSFVVGLISLAVASMIVAIVFGLIGAAHAQGCPCGGRHVWSGYQGSFVYRCYRCEGPRVYGYYRDRDEGCRGTRQAVGDQHLTLDGAKKAANDAWAGTIRFHLGEKFMDLANAREILYTCSRSSIKEQPGVTTLGQTLTRCEISARPCAASVQLESTQP